MNSSVFQQQRLGQRFAPSQKIVGKSLVKQSFKCKAGDKAGTWLPGQQHPEYLDGSLPGDYGFDPLRLGQDPELLQRFRVSELVHCRWAMLGAAGALIPELLGFGDWYSAPQWVGKAGAGPTYFGIPVPFDISVLVGIEVVAIAFVEMQRVYEQDPEKSAYPGGSFDPLNFSKSANFKKLQTNDIKNGRLAMLACAGFAFQHAVYKTSTPLQDLASHISDPTGHNFATNGVSLPQF